MDAMFRAKLARRQKNHSFVPMFKAAARVTLFLSSFSSFDVILIRQGLTNPRLVPLLRVCPRVSQPSLDNSNLFNSQALRSPNIFSFHFRSENSFA